MKEKHLLLPLFLCFCSFSPKHILKRFPSTGTLTVIISNLKNNRGQVDLAIFNKEKEFPKSPGKDVRVLLVSINDRKSVAVFDNLPAGEYAISVFHDENNNKKMDTNFFGIPKEGIGASNNARAHFGPPKYKDAKFNFNGTAQTINISMVYL
jgi:uncharacterized protein (DUF2141 family)